MARRKRQLLEDDATDSSDDEGSLDDFNPGEDPDFRDERTLFENPYQRKRRRTNGNGEDKRTDWTKAPAFVSQNGSQTTAPMDVDEDDAASEGSSESSGDSEGEGGGDEPEYSDHSPPPRPPEDDDAELDNVEEQPRKTGIGIGFSKGGIGSGSSKSSMPSFAKGGIGSGKLESTFTSGSNLKMNSTPPEDSPDSTEASEPRPSPASSLPTAFGGVRSTPTTSFRREAAPAPPKPAHLSRDDMAAFSKLSGSFGARMLAKMGWQAGTGLGSTGEGIVTPVESKMRPERSGIAFRGFKERTSQSVKEAKRRGEEVSDDEDDEKVRQAKKKAKETKVKRSEAWKKPKKSKTRVEHKTYEEIIAEAAQEQSAAAAGVGQIIDATGAVPKEVSSLSEVNLNTWTPSNDPTRIPEVRHNIRLISDACKTDLDGLAREGRSLDERRKFVEREETRLRQKVNDEAELIARLQKVQLLTNEIDSKAKELSSVYEVTLDPLSPLFHNLIHSFPTEFIRYSLDEIVVASITPLFRRLVQQWSPLVDPTAFVSTFRGWKQALRVNAAPEVPQNQIDVYGSVTMLAPVEILKPMTPFESLLWNVWLPKVRMAVNNDWDPREPAPAVRLYEAWNTFLPAFVRDNMLDQLILPKVRGAVADWRPSAGDKTSLGEIVFPWLPHVGLRLEEVLGDARRKIKSLLKGHSIADDIPRDLKAWKDIFDTRDWESAMLRYIVPKLGSTLRTDFSINPRKQGMEPLERVLEWSQLVPTSMFSQILETEFFPKWLDVLHIWLVQPSVSFEEVAQWYSFWKESFPANVQQMPGVAEGFRRGLQLMNKAIELGPDAPTKLAKPDFRAERDAAANAQRDSSSIRAAAAAAKRPSARTQEITFRSLVEEYAASRNLMFIPAGRAHELSRMPMFRVSPSADGKGGILVYILDDAVWAAPQGVGAADEEFRAISLDDMVLRAST